MSSTPLRNAIGFRWSRRLQRALEIVEDRKQLEQHVGRREFRKLAPLAVDALPVVVELGGCAQQPVLQGVLFLLERRNLVAGRPRFAIISSVGRRCDRILHVGFVHVLRHFDQDQRLETQRPKTRRPETTRPETVS